MSTLPLRAAISALFVPSLLAAQASGPATPDTGHRAPARRDSVARMEAIVSRAGRSTGSRYAIGQTSTAAKIDLPLVNTPQSVTVVGRSLIADQGMQSMADVARYLPGISMGAGEGHRDAPTIRGNASTADFFVDGVRDDAQYLRDLYNVERVEALKGSNAMIFGRGGGGGVLNRVTKQAQWTPVRAFSFEGGSFDHRRGAIDAGDSRGLLAGRVNAMYEHSGLVRGTGSMSRQGIDPTVATVLGGTTIRAGYEHFADRRTVDRGIPSFQGAPVATPVGAYFGDPDVSHAFSIVNAGTTTIEHGASDGLRVRNATRLAAYDKFYQNVYPTGVTADRTLATLAGYNHAIQRHNVFNQTDVTWASRAGGFSQALLLGAEFGRQLTDQARNTGYFATATNPAATSMQVPLESPRVAAPVTWKQSASDADSRAVAHVAAAYVQELLSLGEHVQAIAGVRVDRFSLDYRNRRTGESLSRTDRLVSPRAGLVLKPGAPLSIYGSYSVSALPASGDQFTSMTVTTQALEPERFTNREAGIKWQPRAGLLFQGALYRLDRTNTTAPDPSDPSKVVQTGKQRTSGMELELQGDLTARWQLVAGVATQNARITSRTKAAAEGATVPLVPHLTASLWNRVKVAGPLSLGAGLVHQARVYAAIDNSVTLPAFTRIDGAAFLALPARFAGTRLQVNVENVLNTRYYPTSQGNNNIVPGASRLVRIGVALQQ